MGYVFVATPERHALPFLSVALVAASAIFPYRTKRGELSSGAQFFRDFLKLKEVYWHKSARLDYNFWVVGGAIKRFLVVPLVGFL